MSRWDWYQTTVQASEGEVLKALETYFDFSDVVPSRPLNGYHYGAEVRRGDDTLATVWWGGNPGVHVKGTGDRSPAVCKALADFEHSPSRVDACEDWIEEGLFNRMAKGLSKYATDHSIKINQQGDWVRGQARTLYLGSRSSTVQLVLYEKGYESGGDLNWVRLEVRVRPANHAKQAVSRWGPSDAFKASRWLVNALQSIGWESLQAYRVGTVRKPSDTERERAALIRQYSRIISEWADDLGGWEHLGGTLRDAIEEQSFTNGKGVAGEVDGTAGRLASGDPVPC